MTVWRPVPGSSGFLTVDPGARGKASGHLMFPWSRDASAWGMLATPVGLIANGDGPTVLLIGGNHGDELEGPLAIRRLFGALAPEEIRGRIVCIPTLNHAAVCAGRRTSPIDGGNMNRCFLGRADGTMTEQVAHFVEAAFVAEANAVIDIHSGGRTMKFAPFAATHRLRSEALQEQAMRAVAMFGAPYGLVLEELDDRGMLDTAVERREKLFVTTELGGGGGTTAGLVALAERGIRNVLSLVGALPSHEPEDVAPARMLRNSQDGYLAAPRAGMIDYTAALGDAVTQGQPVATLADPGDLGSTPMTLHAPCDGLFLGQFHGGMVQQGDFLGLFAKDLGTGDH